MTPEFLARLERILDRLEPLLPAPREPDWNASIAFRWRRQNSALGRFGSLEPVLRIAPIGLDDVCHAEEAKRLVVRNTRHFVEGLPANNVLLTGARGTGKSTLVKACLQAFAPQGLRLIEVDKDDLADLGDIVARLQGRPERFILFCDDLSFEQGEPGYKAMKSALDGSIASTGDNLLIYATSNRRHLLPETMRENLEAKHQEDGEIHPGDATEEKISLSERFGLWVAFYPFRQTAYLDVVAHWLRRQGVEFDAEARAEALRFALERGSRSGRVAAQFARDWAARMVDRDRASPGPAV